MPSVQVIIDSSRARSGAREADQAFDAVGRSARSNESRLSRFDSSLDAVGITAGRVAPLLAGAFGALVGGAGLGTVIQTFGQFELTLATVGQVARASASELDALTAAALQAGSTTSFTASQAGEGLLFLSRAGFSASDAIEALNPVLSLATAGALELGEAADIASNVLSQFGLTAEATGRAGDVLVAVSNRANTDVRNLGQALSFAGPIAAAFGVDLETTASALGVLGDAGIQATRAGTGLNNVLRGLASISAQGEEALSRLGLTAEDVDIQTVGLVEALRRLNQAGLDANSAEALFGRIGQAAGINLSNAAQRLGELTEAAQQSEGASQALADTLGDTLPRRIDGLRSAAEGAAVAVGQGGLGTAAGFVTDALADSIRAIAGFESATDASRVTVVATTSALGALAGVAGFGGVVLAARAVPAALALVTASLGPIGGFAAGVGAVAAAFVALSRDTDDAAASLARAKSELEDFEALGSQFARIEASLQVAVDRGEVESARRALANSFRALDQLEVEARLNPNVFIDLDQLSNRLPEIEGEFDQLGARVSQSLRDAFDLGEGDTRSVIERVVRAREAIESALQGSGGIKILETDEIEQAVANVDTLLRQAARSLGTIDFASEFGQAFEDDFREAFADLDAVLFNGTELVGVRGDELAETVARIRPDIEARLQGRFDALTRAIEEDAANAARTARESGASIAGQAAAGFRSIAETGVLNLGELLSGRAESRQAVEGLVQALEFEASIADRTSDAQERLRLQRELLARSTGLAADEEGGYLERLLLAQARTDAATDAAKAYSQALQQQGQVASQTGQLVASAVPALEARAEALQREIDLVGASNGAAAAARAEAEGLAIANRLRQQAAIETAAAEQLLATATGAATVEAGLEAAAARERAEALEQSAQAAEEAAQKVAALEEGLAGQRQTQALQNGLVATAGAGLARIAFEADNAAEAVRRLLEQLAQQVLTAGFQNALGGIFLPNANGNLFSGIGSGGGAQVKQFASGGLIQGPVSFPLAGGGIGLAAEKGPNFEELLLPVTRKNGRVMVESAGGGGRGDAAAFGAAVASTLVPALERLNRQQGGRRTVSRQTTRNAARRRAAGL